MELNGFGEQLGDFLRGNHFASGGLVVGLAGVVIAVLRKLPGQIVRFAWRQISIEVAVRNDTDLFDAVEHWLARRGTGGRTRVFAAQYRFGAPELDPAGDQQADGLDRRKVAGLELAPGEGSHWIWFCGKPVLLVRSAERPKQQTNYIGRARESFTLYFPGRRLDLPTAFLNEAVEFCNPPDRKLVRIFTAGLDEWRASSACRVRPPGTVVLRDGVLDRLVADVRRFFDRQAWYTEIGIPYRRGYLFTGPPGNGKTTTVQVLAGVFGAPVCVLDLGNPMLSDEKLRVLMNTAPVGAFFLLEDIDALFRKRHRQVTPKTDEGEAAPPTAGITFSGLLNALDGVMAPSGRLVFMSTNHPEKLDPALIRPGRVDVRIEFPDADAGQARQMFLRFFSDGERIDRLADEFARSVGDGVHSMAAVQGLLLESVDDPIRAVRLARQHRPPEAATFPPLSAPPPAPAASHIGTSGQSAARA
jgi:chaperone BCS1